MTFFNPKEEVLDIQLTQYGRHLLSKGTMRPVYYAFFDEGVIYDLKHAGLEENRKDIESRIQEETPRLKTRHCFTGRDEFLFDGIGDIEDRKELGIYEKLNTLTDPMGTSDLNSTKLPYFSLNLLLVTTVLILPSVGLFFFRLYLTIFTAFGCRSFERSIILARMFEELEYTGRFSE